MGHILLTIQVILGYVLLAALVTRFAVLCTAGGPAGTFAEEKGQKTEDRMKRQPHYSKASVNLIFVLLFLVVGCAPSAKLQREFRRPTGIGPGYRKVFVKYSASIPERMKQHRIPGLSITVVDREGILWAAGFGRTGKGNQPVTPETLFSIQSMSKTFTATAVMIAVQDGLVDLDTPITTYLPEFIVNSRWEDNPQDKMTLRHLLTHTAGFTHEAPVGNNLDALYDTFEQHVLSISNTWLRCRVGAKYYYSNLGIDLAAYIVQVKSGMSITEYFKQKVFDPLGMPTSSIDYDIVEQFPDRALGHMPFVAEVPVAIPMIAAGGVYTSAAELSRFVQFHLNRGAIDGRRLLDASFVDTMYTSSEIAKGYKLNVLVRLVLALGYCDPGMKLVVEKKDGYLCIGEDKLEEFQPGLFFTPSGEALDFRDSVPTWRNIRLEKSFLFWSL